MLVYLPDDIMVTILFICPDMAECVSSCNSSLRLSLNMFRTCHIWKNKLLRWYYKSISNIVVRNIVNRMNVESLS
jgi:hypothetical protein